MLFFEKGAPARKVWFYQLNPGRNMGKTNPLNDGDLVDFIERQETFADLAQSGSVEVGGINATTYDLSVKTLTAATRLPCARRRTSPLQGPTPRKTIAMPANS